MGPSMTAYDDVMRELREFSRYTGDGKPGAPVNAPLPIGDPQSGVHNPKKANLRLALGNLAQELMAGIAHVNGMIPAIEAARDAALADIEEARVGALAEVAVLVDQAEAARDLSEDYRDASQQYRDASQGYSLDALSYKTQAEIAAIAAGAPLFTAAPDLGTAPSPYLLQVEAGTQVFTHDGSTATMVGWLGKVEFPTVTALLAWTGPLGPFGTIVWAQGFPYRVGVPDAINAHVQTAYGDWLYVVANEAGAVNIEAFGALVGEENVVASTAALRMAVRDFDLVFVPSGTFWINKTINVKRAVNLYGLTGTQAGSYPSQLKFEDGIVGLFMHRGDTYADDTGVPIVTVSHPGGSDGWNVHHLALLTRAGTTAVTDGTSHAVWIKARGHIYDCQIQGWGGNGLHAYAAFTSTDPYARGNCNNWGASRCRITHCQDGVFTEGPDANVGLGLHLDCSQNRRFGVYDSAFLGCSWVNCHFNGNAVGAVEHDNPNARSTFMGCYTEPGASAIWRVSRAALIVGGQFSGVTVQLHPDGAGWNFTSFVDARVNVGHSLYTPTFQSKAGVSGAKLDQIWNTGSISTSRGAGVKFTIGVETPGSFTDVAAIYGTGGASNTAAAGVLRFDIYDPAIPGFVRALNVIGANKTLTPGSDNEWGLGAAAARFKDIYAANGTINTSDEREKQNSKGEPGGEAIPEEWLDAWADVKWSRFKWNDAVAEKGPDGARWHIGLVAQQVGEAFAAHGLDAQEIGLLCFDEWEDEYEPVLEQVQVGEDDNGEPILEERDTGEQRLVREAGSRWGVRYDEAQAMEAAYQRRRMDRIEGTV